MKVWKDLKHVNNSDTADLSREKSAWNISEKALSGLKPELQKLFWYCDAFKKS